MDPLTIALWIITMVWLVVSLFKDKKRTFDSIKMSSGMMKNLGGDMIAVLLLIGFILTLLPPETISQFLGQKSTFLSTIILAVIGCLTLIPAFVAFPLAGSLVHSGASVMPIVAFITTLTMVGVVTFPLEKREFGLKFTIVRNSLSFVFAIVIAVIMGVLI